MSGLPLAERVRRALDDPALEGNVLRATDASLAHRREVVAERPDWEALRRRAAALRDRALATLPDQVERFAREARSRGAAADVRASVEAATTAADRREWRSVRQALQHLDPDAVGMPIARERIEYAKYLMDNADDSMATIATECGFFDQSHFTKTFQALEHMPPSRYRRRSHGG